MTHYVRLFLTTIVALAIAPAVCNAQNLTQFDPSKVDADSGIVSASTVDSGSQDYGTSDRLLVRNCLVIGGLGLTFCLGMAITATTIQQNRPSTPQRTSFYAS